MDGQIRRGTRKEKETGFLNTHQEVFSKTENTLPKQKGDPRPCLACDRKGHRVRDCERFKKSSLDDRLKVVQEKQLCRRCLAPHGKWPCRTRQPCGVGGCQEMHHMLLHCKPSPSTSYGASGIVTTHRHKQNSTLFKIIPVMLHGNGKSLLVHAFLDDGSDLTLIESKVADELGLDGVERPLCIEWTGSVSRNEDSSRVVQLTISKPKSEERHALTNVRTVPDLGLPKQSLNYDQLAKDFPHLRGLPICSYTDVTPKILIGVDHARLKLTLKRRERSAGEPVATKTRLGWVIFGGQSATNNLARTMVHTCKCSKDDELHVLARGNLAAAPSMGIAEHAPPETSEDQRARRVLQETTKRIPSGKYETEKCSAQYTKSLNASEHRVRYPEAAAAIVEGTYVDDFLDSRDSAREAVEIAQGVVTINGAAGFQIPTWQSNSIEVLREISNESENSTKRFSVDGVTATERVLGMVWRPSPDVFVFENVFRDDLQTLLTGHIIPTKRQVLQVVMSLFDPLGIIAAFTIHGKILMQDIWRSGVNWDESIRLTDFENWKRWIGVLPDLAKVTIPRCYFPNYDPISYDSLQLHIFTDASETAYASVAFFRIVDRGSPRCCLVTSKAKVTSLRPQSVPRNELNGAVIGARLMESIVDSHQLKICKRYFWTDSSVVISWLHADPRKYRQYVGFRVGEILSKTQVNEWRWIASKLNVADAATKWESEWPSPYLFHFYHRCRTKNRTESTITLVPLDSPDDPVLTPNCFLLMTSSGSCAPKVEIGSTSNLKANWRTMEEILNQFWKRWIEGYLPTIARRTKWYHDVRPLQEGDLVVIVDETVRNGWLRGRVSRSYPGSDGQVRRVDVETSSGILQRGVAKVALLDLDVTGKTY
ncbi:uncharacterized protein LOC129737701 [Uranotaenia lowii]|uniref:uncharacterized protein LOC129737701 n=1 Tax=Uranotaenia lowii TaxID=190385 RepID=UPI002479CC27|nr:uncharacterized protein LOC129737701 [Uranotaenia lowii]